MAKALALSISLILLATMLNAPVLTAAVGNEPPPELSSSDPLIIAQPEAAIDKTEVIYGRLDTKGAAGDLHVVNHFSVPEAGIITDYGAYDEIVWLTGREPRKNKDEIKIEAEAGNYYYEGVLKNRELPWEFRIEWYLDGKSVDPAGLSGANGDLKIALSSRANPSCRDLTEYYALQISFSFPRDRATSIVAESATIAEAGNNTMVNYVVLPGFDADLAVSAKIKDFHMPGISISAVKLDISFEMPDVSDLNDDMSQLVDAIAELKDGVDKLAQGSGDLKSGLSEIVSGTATLGTEGQKLTDGVSDAADGVKKYIEGISAYLGGVNEYISGVSDYTRGVSDLVAGATAIDAGAGELLQGLNQLADQGQNLTNGSRQILDALQQINAQLSLEGVQVPTAAELAGLAQSVATLNGILANIAFPAGNDGVAWIAYLTGKTEAEAAAYFNQLNEAEKNTLVGRLNGYRNAINMAQAESNKALGGLNAVMVKLQSLAALVNGTAEKPGLQALIGGLNQLYTQYNAFHKGLVQYTGGVQQIARGVAGKDPAKPGLKAGLSQLAGGLEKLNAAGKEIRGGGDKLKAAGTRIKNGGTKLVTGLSELKLGTSEYIDGVRELSEGLQEYQDGLAEYTDGIKELASGVNELADGTRDMDEKMLDEINKKIDELLHKDFVPVSFVSPMNTNVKSVQFVLLTDEIPAPAKPVIEVPKEEDKGFLERIRDIFR
ncbi:MAG: hypothetical protein QM216_01260 [Bacillota bacterium]|nr:hypothetical protein [Bacillota bacterium]